MISDKILLTVNFILLGVVMAVFARSLVEAGYWLVDWLLGKGRTAWWIPRRDPDSKRAQTIIIRVFGISFALAAAVILVTALVVA